jgi:hypothetical protein
MGVEVLRIEVVRLVEHHNLLVGLVKLRRTAGAAVASFEHLHSVAVVGLMKTRNFADLEHHTRAVDHRTGLKIVFGRMEAVLVIDYVVAEDCSHFVLHRWADMMMAVPNQSILLGNCPQKSIRNYFPAANINNIPLYCTVHLPKMSSADDH